MSEKVNGGHIVFASESDRKVVAPVSSLPASRFDYALSESDKMARFDLDPEKIQVISEHPMLYHISGAPAIWIQLAKYSLESCEDQYRLQIAPSVKFEHTLPFIFKRIADNGMELIGGLAEDIPLVLGWVTKEFPEFPFVDENGGDITDE